MDQPELINFWRMLDLTTKPFKHPSDTALLNDHWHSYASIPAYFEEAYWQQKDKFHLELLPVPYVGDLQNAKIFILLLNPGFNITDYYVEKNDSIFLKALQDNLRQENLNASFPFIFLNPEFGWHLGFRYWVSRLRPYIDYIKQRDHVSHIEALSKLAKKVAVLELVPYHSTNFWQHSLINKLQSTRQIRQYVQQYLIPKTIAKEACLICTRKVREWNITAANENIVLYTGAATRGAYFSLSSKAYPIITRFL